MGVAKTSKNSAGVPVRVMMAPFVILLAVLHIVIILLIFRINDISSDLSQSMNDYANYKAKASNILAGQSVLNESLATLLLMTDTPVGPTIGPAVVYATEQKNTVRRAAAVAEEFKASGLPDSILEKMELAIEYSNTLEENQNKILAFIYSAYTKPEAAELADLVIPPLSEGEEGMTTEQKIAAAKNIAVTPEYADTKFALVSVVNMVIGEIDRLSGEKAATAGRTIAITQLMIRLVTITIILVIVITLLVFYLTLIKPLSAIVKNIRVNSVANEDKGLREIRLIASAYNSLIARRAKFEDFLRSTTDTGVLAKLPGRSVFTKRLDEEQQNGTKKLTLILLDVADYDKTLEKLGESAAEQLLKTAAECVLKSFGNEDSDNCYVYDTSRFAVVASALTRELLDDELELFAQEQSKWGISIYWGVSSTEDFQNTEKDKMIQEAERKLYVQRKVMFTGL